MRWYDILSCALVLATVCVLAGAPWTVAEADEPDTARQMELWKERAENAERNLKCVVMGLGKKGEGKVVRYVEVPLCKEGGTSLTGVGQYGLSVSVRPAADGVSGTLVVRTTK